MPTKYLRDGDLALHYVHTGPTTLPDQPPELRRGAMLLFLAGEGGSAALWSRQLAHFAAAHSPLALDLPAHGRSSGLEAPAGIAEAAEVVAGFLTQLASPPAVVVGHGFAGHVALELAASRPEVVRAVVAIGTALRPAGVEEAIGKLEPVVQGRIGQQFDTPFFGDATDPGVMRELWTEMVKTDPRVRLSDLRAYARSRVAEGLGAVAKPVLVIVGEADRICPRAAAEDLAGAIPGARLVAVPGGGHVVHLEKPDEVNRAIEDLIAGLS